MSGEKCLCDKLCMCVRARNGQTCCCSAQQWQFVVPSVIIAQHYHHHSLTYPATEIWDGQTNDNDNAHCRCFSASLLRFVFYAKIYHILHPMYRITRTLHVIFFSNIFIHLKQNFSGCYCCRYNQLTHTTTGIDPVSHCSDCHSYGPVELFVCVPKALNYPAC